MTVLVIGQGKAVKVEVKFGNSLRSWIFRDGDDTTPDKTVTFKTSENGSVLLAAVYTNGSRSLKRLTKYEDRHTCLFMNEKQSIHISYGGNELTSKVSHTTDIKCEHNGRIITSRGKKCTQSLFDGRVSLDTDAVIIHSAGYLDADKQHLLKACPLASKLF